MKVTQVTADGELIEDAFDTHVMEDVSYKMQRDLPSPVEREIARRLRAVEEKLACVTDRLKRLDRKTSLREDQGKSLKAMLRQKIERLPQLMKAGSQHGKRFERLLIETLPFRCVGRKDIRGCSTHYGCSCRPTP